MTDPRDVLEEIERAHHERSMSLARVLSAAAYTPDPFIAPAEPKGWFRRLLGRLSCT